MWDSELFADANILAPMVRFGILPSRLLALDYGANLVYTEEIVDELLLKSNFEYNSKLKTVDLKFKTPKVYNLPTDCVELYNDLDLAEPALVFQTNVEESSNLILQIGTKYPEKACQIIEKFYKWKQECNIFDDTLNFNLLRGIDLNMGCPKEFSLKAGIGSALIQNDENIETACSVLLSMISKNRDFGWATSCKIRVLPSLTETLSLCSKLWRTGIDALTVHGRTPNEMKTNAYPNRNDFIREISRLAPAHCVIIANGGSTDIKTHDDIDKFKRDTGCKSVMLARSAMRNLSIFSTNMENRDSVIEKYLSKALTYETEFNKTKWNLQQMFYHDGKGEKFKRLLKAKDYQDLGNVWHIDDHLLKNYTAQTLSQNNDVNKQPLDLGHYHYEPKLWKTTLMHCIGNFEKSIMNKSSNPKIALIDICTKLNHDLPYHYSVSNNYTNQSFKGITCVNGKKYSTEKWEKSKKVAEQSSALCALAHLFTINNDIN